MQVRQILADALLWEQAVAWLPGLSSGRKLGGHRKRCRGRIGGARSVGESRLVEPAIGHIDLEGSVEFPGLFKREFVGGPS